MKAYLDSSFLVSMYALDVNSPKTAAELARFHGTLMLSSLGEVELVNALELRIFRKQVTRRETDLAHAAFVQDVQNGILRVFDLAPAALIETKRLILKTTALVGCRTADIVHVAAATVMQADRMLTFDLRQKELARRIKLQTN